MKSQTFALVGMVFVTACAAPQPDYMTVPAGIQRDQQAPPPETVGAGAVQMIKVGDSKQSVLERLGSPNIFSSTEDGGELYIYDKISFSSEAQVGYTSRNSVAGVAQSSSRTMMTTIYFDAAGKVIDIKYRSSRY
jgi:outer membrane protein assembly factor BamE (lipoprotein component of BamABCDE complex)